MTPRAYALVVALGLALATGAFAAANISRTPAEPTASGGAQTLTTREPARWVPHWLRETLSRAIADATDPRERK